MKFITVNKVGIINEVTMRSNDVKEIYKKCGFKNNNNFSHEHSWEITVDGNVYKVSVYAKNNGRALNENKYELPPPIDTNLYFGNIAITCYNKKLDEYIDLTKNLWLQIYNNLMGGFEDITQTDDEEEEFEEDMYDTDELTNEGYLKDGFVVDDNELTYDEYEKE